MSNLKLIKISKIFLFLLLITFFYNTQGWCLDNQKEAADELLYRETYLQPPEEVKELLLRDRHYDVLSNLSPDKDHFLIPIQEEFSSLKRMAQRTLRLAMLEFCPDVNREWRLSTYGVKGLKIYSYRQGKAWEVQLPANILVSDFVWSPAGNKLAFLAHLGKGSEVWVADVSTGEAKAVSKALVMVTISGARGYRRSGSPPSQTLQWRPDGSLVTLLVPSNRGSEPQPPTIPSSPLIRRTREKPTPTRTFPFLIRTPYDKELFRFYTTSQLAILYPGQEPHYIGEPGMFESIAVSPDGKYILAERLTEPFSYLVSYRSFPRSLEVLNETGKVIATIRQIPLQEAMSRERGSDRNWPREVKWRPDGKGLIFLWREKAKEDKKEKAPSKPKDRLMFLPPPFDLDKAITLVATEKRFVSVDLTRDGSFALATLSGRNDDGQNRQEIVAYDLRCKPPRAYVLVKDIDPEDLLHHPGNVMVQRTANGIPYVLLSSDKKKVFLQGRGYQENLKPRPFIDQVEIKTQEKTRLFEGSPDYYEQPLLPLDENLNKLIIQRESPTDFPDCYLWEKGKVTKQLTSNKDPYPEITAAKREHFTFIRRDGLEIHAWVLLPIDYQAGQKVPAVFWTYPREYQSVKDYNSSVLRSYNLNAFRHFSTRNASQIWLTQGYAVVIPDIPILGRGNQYNNNYIAHLVDSMYAAIRKVDQLGYVDVDRLGHGGHSYGAFATANILAHTPFFKAGIAGDGAYNRTLTPMTFQNERRFIWEAQDVYIEMSPFFEADHLETPLLMYHGAKDNNSGTFLIQSERMIQALTGLGKKAVLYVYPFESHGPRCLETYFDLWARWLAFFDKYVKNPQLEKKKEEAK